MGFTEPERLYLEASRVGRLATADGDGRPHVVPICFSIIGDDLVTPLDEKPKRGSVRDLRRVQDIRSNPKVSVVVDHYTEDWDRLGWLQVRGTATLVQPTANDHESAVTRLRKKYDQYATHALEGRPMIRIRPGHVVSWGCLDHQA